MRERASSGPSSFLILGHRGSPRRARENTLASFGLALREGADGFETDLRRTADGEIILFHDPEIDGRPTASMSLDEIRASRPDVPRLGELGPFLGDATLVLEVKESGWEEDLRREAGSWSGIIVSSFNGEVIRSLSRSGVGFELGFVASAPLDDAMQALRGVGAGWFFPEVTSIGESEVDLLHAAGIRIVPWTGNDEECWSRLASIGCDGVITDLPREAAAWREKTFRRAT